MSEYKRVFVENAIHELNRYAQSVAAAPDDASLKKALLSAQVQLDLLGDLSRTRITLDRVALRENRS